MGKESQVEINGHLYRYEYVDGATLYRGPVGDAPALGEEEFFAAMAEREIPLDEEAMKRMFGVTFGDVEFLGRKQATEAGEQWEHDAWTTTIRKGDKSMDVPFMKGTGHKGEPPGGEEVFNAILSDIRSYEYSKDKHGNPDFSYWAGEFGTEVDDYTFERLKGMPTSKMLEMSTEEIVDRFEDDYEGGYLEADVDTVKAYRTWKIIEKQGENLQRLLQEDYDKFLETEWEDY